MAVQRITRQQVHKESESGVFLTTIEDLGQSVFKVGIDCSAIAEPLFPNGMSPLVGLEIVRQVGLLIGHHAVKIPLDWAFLLHELSFAPESTPAHDADTRPDIYAIIEINSTTVARSGVVDLDARVGFHIADALVAVGGGGFRSVPRRTYRAIRRRHVNASVTDTQSTDDALIDPIRDGSTLTALLGWPTANSLIFDHDVDHIPGLLFARAGLDAHRSLSGLTAEGARLRCSRFGEIGMPTDVRCSYDGITTRTSFSQSLSEIAVLETHNVAASISPSQVSHSGTSSTSRGRFA